MRGDGGPGWGNAQRVQLRQVLERRPPHGLDRVVVEVSGRAPDTEFSDPSAGTAAALGCLRPRSPGRAPPPPARPPGPQSPRRSRDSHRLQQRVPHEGLLWDGPDVVVVEAPGKQRGQRGPGTGVTSRGHTGSREQAHRPPPQRPETKETPAGRPRFNPARDFSLSNITPHPFP